MRTRLPVFLDRLIEGGWLAALVVTPLFFNLLSARTFEPDKAALLRALILVMLAAWGGWRVARPRGGEGWLEWRSVSGWLVGSSLALAVVLLVSALTGLAPRISLLGSYNRDQGVVTLLAYLALFLLVAARLRAPDQLRRLLDTIVLVGLAVGVYSVLQRFGLDPVPWGGYGADVTSRVIGSQGNATFLAGYLVLATPIALYSLLVARREGRNGAMIAYGAALVFELLALIFSDSRGATLGLGAGLVIWGLAHAAWRGSRRLATITAGLAGGALVVLLLLNLAGSAAANVPLLGRLAQLTSPTTGSNQVRALVWQGMSDMIEAEGGRIALGVGSEALYLGYYPYQPTALRAIENPLVGTQDRSHNEILDRLATTGIFGLAAWLALVDGLLYGACAWLGLTPTSARRWSLIAALAFGAALGALAPVLMGGGSLRYMGLGLGVGLVAGLAAWLLLRGLRPDHSALDDPALAVVPMLLGVLVTHLVEIQVGIPVTATQTLFWASAGAMMAVGGARLKAPTLAPAPAEAVVTVAAAERGGKRGRASTRPPATPRASRAAERTVSTTASTLLGLVVGLTLATLTYGLVVRGINLAPAFVILFVLAMALLAAGAALVAMPGVFVSVAVTTAVVYLVLHLPIALATTGGPAGFALFVGLLLVWLGVFAWLAARDVPVVAGQTTRGPLATAAALGLVALAGIWFLSLQPIYADSYIRLGQLYGQIGRWDQAIAAYEHALRVAPNQDFVRPNIAQAYLAQAQTATDPAARQAAFDKARAVLQEASRLSPGNPEYLVNLGAAEQYWADKGPSETKLRLQSDAEAHYRAAAALAPRDPHVLRRWGRLKLEEGAPAEAIPLLEKALSLLLPDGATTALVSTGNLAAEIRTDLARAYAATGRSADAIAQARAALSLAAPDAQAPIQELLKQLGASGS